MPNLPAMIRPFISSRQLGDAFRTAFVLAEEDETATLYVPSYLAVVTVPKASLAKAQAITYRPRRVRANMLARARLYRKHGHRFPRAATIRVLRMLGAGKAAIDAVVSAPPLPEVVAARARRSERRAQAAELSAAVAAIEAKIALQPAVREAASRPHRPRLRTVYPGQLALAL